MLSDGGGIISESGGDYFSELGGEIISESGGRIASEFAPLILAVDNLGLCRMHLKSARCQPRTQLHLEGFGLLLALAVNKTIVGISTPWMRPRHPEIKCIVQKEIRQDRANHAPCGVPRDRSMTSPFFSMGATSHLSM